MISAFFTKLEKNPKSSMEQEETQNNQISPEPQV